ncbi:MAG: GFA family protein [Marinicella sp.]
MSEKTTGQSGGCDCGHIRYELTAHPMFVHCCHCTWCQRETGSAFALNAIVEATAIKLKNNEPLLIETPSESGGGQKVARCPQCQIAVWSHYSGMGDRVAFLKVGTLDEAQEITPDVHIYTQSKLPWFQLPQNIPSFERYYNMKEMWPAASLLRFKAIRNKNI